MGYIREPLSELDRIKEFAEKYILSYISAEAQDNIASKAVIVQGKVIKTQDDLDFLAAVDDRNTFVDAVRAACAGLVGNPNYTDPAEWPACPANVVALGQDN